ncbi:glycosyl transferase family 2 [Chryseobacterium sp. T16E-39]|uniref:glycosyltransferase n=1 Tax=Chryseobacterium sp. T16E-39 TaxID=2015076 RepID=UPI000B5B296A|nr:glycosyltransferase [Chryseobacterium sp. T16E-39]ASK31280.1 glycosyl transferase family 2 [Chryseobacterium sp. T16E-39]
MKITICIPVYNFDVRELVSDLKKEIIAKDFNAEIILIDDQSKEEFKQINEVLQKQVDQFIYLDKNIGRSKIRNLFLTYSKGDYLLFLDCDGKVTDNNFVGNYIQFINENPGTKVIYGGRVVSESNPDRDHYLRWKFAVERENLPVSSRLENPYLSFQTNNFIIGKEVFQKISFNSEFQKYGYEDLLFAMDLKSNNIKIDHIHNPILNIDVEDNRLYLEKVKESVDSLSKMLADEELNSKMSEVKLVKAFNMICRIGLKRAFIVLFKINKPMVEKKLLKGKGKINLRYLDYYKLGLLLQKTE